MFILTYGNDATRSAGDRSYATRRGALNGIRAHIRRHPDAEAWIHRPEHGCLGQTVAHYDPHADALMVNPPATRAA
jgi:hypothetical protein